MIKHTYKLKQSHRDHSRIFCAYPEMIALTYCLSTFSFAFIAIVFTRQDFSWPLHLPRLALTCPDKPHHPTCFNLPRPSARISHCRHTCRDLPRQAPSAADTLKCKTFLSLPHLPRLSKTCLNKPWQQRHPNAKISRRRPTCPDLPKQT